MSEQQKSAEVMRAYEAYSSLFDDLNHISPQLQGLDTADYVQAIQDPATTVVPIETTKGKTIEFPVLTAVNVDSWLNADFFARAFPEETKDATLRRLSVVDVVPVTSELVSNLQELAEERGVVVFDYPDSDDDYEERIRVLLSEAGVEIDEVRELGTQAYFAGKCVLKDGKEEGETLAFQDVARSTTNPDKPGEPAASYAALIDESQMQALYDSYTAAFEVLNDHPCRQGLDPDEFRDMMTKHDDIAKIFVRTGDAIAAVCILASRLDHFDWVSQDFFQDSYGEDIESGEFLYFPAIATDPAQQGERFGQALIDKIDEITKAGNNEPVIAFDCCDFNGWLPAYIEEIINKTPNHQTSISELGRQYYKSYKLKPSE